MPCSAMSNNNKNDNTNKINDIYPCVFDACFLEKQTKVPEGFVWLEVDQPSAAAQAGELREPLVDLAGFLEGDEEATRAAAQLVAQSCQTHGFFQVTNHGVDPGLISRSFDRFEAFFKRPLAHKMRAQRLPGDRWGYSAAHAERFTTNLPWKETISFGFHEDPDSPVAVEYFKNTLGEDFVEDGIEHQKYCEAMVELCNKILELLGISLGVDRHYYREFFSDSHSIMRCNYYPSCPQPDLVLGTGAHTDPTSITLLQQDDVCGLEVFHNDKWYSVNPVKGAIVVNLGDTFMALSNGKYKSCLHRAVVNKESGRKSLAFFLCPHQDRVVKPPNSLVLERGSRKYPDYTWYDMIQFTRQHYRADPDTLQNFFKWLKLNPSPKLIA